MGVGWLGFAKGASKAGLDAIVAREEEDSRKKLAELQEKLRRETSEIEFKRDVQREIDREKRGEEKLSELSYDPSTGKMRMTNKLGTRSEVRDATAAEKLAWERGEEEYGLKRQDAQLSLDAKRANINQSNASAEASRAQAGYYRSGVGRSGGSGSGAGPLDGTGKGLTLQERVQEALYRNKDLINSVTSADEGLGRGTVEVGIEELIRQMAARGEDPSQIDSKIRQRLIPLLKSKALSNPNLKTY